MLDIFLKIVDRVIELIKHSQVQRHSLFSEIARPLFESLEPVAKDYFALFHTATTALKNGHLDVATIQDLDRARTTTAYARMRVRAMARAICARASLDKLHEFADSVLRFFYFSELTSYDTASAGVKLVEALEILAKPTEAAESTASEFAAYALQSLTSRWQTVVRTYAELQISTTGGWGG